MLDRNSVFVLEIMSWTICALAGIAVAWFQFCESGQTKEEKEATRERYGRKWERIRDTEILQLPERTIDFLLSQKAVVPSVWIKFFKWPIENKLRYMRLH